MKKVFALALMVALVLSLAVPAAAASSATGSTEDLKPTVVAPVEEESEVVETDAGLVLVSAEEAEKLTEDDQATFVEAKEALAEAAPEGMAVRYFFYAKTDKEASATLKIGDYAELKIMQYIDGKWVELEFTVNPDGTITVLNIVDGPMAICVK